MEIIEEKQESISIFKLNGRLDSNTSQGFEKKISVFLNSTVAWIRTPLKVLRRKSLMRYQMDRKI
jgi:hypothetical protein